MPSEVIKCIELLAKEDNALDNDGRNDIGKDKTYEDDTSTGTRTYHLLESSQTNDTDPSKIYQQS
jgi:hypothetical protein